MKQNKKEPVEPIVETIKIEEIKNPTLNEDEIKMIKFCLEKNKNCVGYQISLP